MPNSSGSSKSSPVLYHNFFETVSSRFKGAKTDTGESVSNFSKKFYADQLKHQVNPQADEEIPEFQIATLGTYLANMVGTEGGENQESSLGLWDTLLQEYESHYPMKYQAKKSEAAVSIPEDVAVVQALFDTDVVAVYQKDTQEVAYYTAVRSICQEHASRYTELEKKIGEKNARRVIHAMRIDATYVNAHEYTLKTVNLTAKTELKMDECIFIPLYSLERLYTVLDSFFFQSQQGLKLGDIKPARDSALLEVRQTMANVQTVRYLTASRKGIAKYRGVDDIGDIPQNAIYRLPLFRMYVPSLGAPVTSLGLSAINVFSLDSLHAVKWSHFSAPLPDNSMQKLIQGEVINVWLRGILETKKDADGQETSGESDSGTDSNGARTSLITMLNQTYGLDIPYDAGVTAVIKEVRDLEPVKFNDLFARLPQQWQDYAQRMGGVLTQCTPVQVPSTATELADMLATGAYRIVFGTKAGKFSSALVSNSEFVLRSFYGKAWWRTYEVSTFARQLFAFRKLSSGVPLEVVADLLGMAVGDVQAWVLESTFVPRAFLSLIGESTSLPPQQVKQVWSQFVEANVSGFVSQTEEDQQAGTFQSPTFAQVIEALGSVGIASVQDAYKAAFKNETSTWFLDVEDVMRMQFSTEGNLVPRSEGSYVLERPVSRAVNPVELVAQNMRRSAFTWQPAPPSCIPEDSTEPVFVLADGLTSKSIRPGVVLARNLFHAKNSRRQFMQEIDVSRIVFMSRLTTEYVPGTNRVIEDSVRYSPDGSVVSYDMKLF